MVRLLRIHSLQFKSPDHVQSKRLQLNATAEAAKRLASIYKQAIIKTGESIARAGTNPAAARFGAVAPPVRRPRRYARQERYAGRFAARPPAHASRNRVENFPLGPRRQGSAEGASRESRFA